MTVSKALRVLSTLLLALSAVPALATEASAATVDGSYAGGSSHALVVSSVTHDNGEALTRPNPARCYPRYSAMGANLLASGHYYLTRRNQSAVYVCEICIPVGSTWACQDARDPLYGVEAENSAQ